MRWLPVTALAMGACLIAAASASAATGGPVGVWRLDLTRFAPRATEVKRKIIPLLVRRAKELHLDRRGLIYVILRADETKVQRIILQRTVEFTRDGGVIVHQPSGRVWDRGRWSVKGQQITVTGLDAEGPVVGTIKGPDRLEFGPQREASGPIAAKILDVLRFDLVRVGAP